MGTTADLKNGSCIIFHDDLYFVVEFQHVKPGKGGAFVRTKLKQVYTGKVLSHTFTAGTRIAFARVETRAFQFLYKDDKGYHFMDMKDFEQTTLEKNLVQGADFLKDGQEVDILFHSEKNAPIACALPPFVSLKVDYTEPGIKGDTATSATKPARLETGVVIQVPLFIEQDTYIKVDTRTKKYHERVKHHSP